MNEKLNSLALLQRARAAIPGAVNSPVRAWNAVGGEPRFISRGAGAYLFDADGHKLIDYVGSYGPAILGHAHPAVVRALAQQAQLGLSFGAPTELEVELAETIKSAITTAERVRLVSSGTEAGMTALRLARAFTGREKIIKFDGCYHGHSDALLVKAGSGALTLALPDSHGVPAAFAGMTAVARYNSVESVEEIFAREKNSIAAVIVEPVAANMGVVPPAPGFLQALRELTAKFGALLICDEVITGFRLRFGTISEAMGVAPDLVMLGKIIGGGMPIGAVAGRAEIMEQLAPLGPVYQAGTLSGNPLSVRAGLETLALLKGESTYQRLENLGARLAAGLDSALKESGRHGCVNRAGSLLTLFIGSERVRDADEARTSSTTDFAAYFAAMLEREIYLPPSQFEAMFISLAHTDADIDATVAAARAALKR